jgi:hypothetical protein
MPPSFVALNDEVCLAHIKQMYDFLQMAAWQTCVVCWRAWYAVPFNFDFGQACGRRAQSQKWYNPRESVIFGARQRKNINRWYIDSADGSKQVRRSGVKSFLEANYPADVCESIWIRLVEKPWLEQDLTQYWARDVTICKSCAPHVHDGKLRPPSEIRLADYAVDPVFVTKADDSQTLSAAHERWMDHEIDSDEDTSDTLNRPQMCILGRSVVDFAPAVALLTDHEEMVIALVHPLVQVYTIPRTGQLAYVGHICNFRQKVSKFLSSLPIPKDEVPFVMVRPRRFKNRFPPKHLLKSMSEKYAMLSSG